MKLILKNLLIIFIGLVPVTLSIYVAYESGYLSIFKLTKSGGVGRSGPTSLIIFGVLGIIFVFLGIRNLIRRE